MHRSRHTFTPAWSLLLFLLALAPPVRASGGWDKCPQSVSITPDPNAPNSSGVPLSVLRQLAPAVLVTGVTYDFGAVCPVPTQPTQDRRAQHRRLQKRPGRGTPMEMSAAPVAVRFYQENVGADDARKQIVLLPFQAPQRSVIITPTVVGNRGRFVPVKFSEPALGNTHEQKIVTSVSIGNEKALATFVLISATFYRQELGSMGHRRHVRHHRHRPAARRAARTPSRA